LPHKTEQSKTPDMTGNFWLPKVLFMLSGWNRNPKRNEKNCPRKWWWHL